MGGWQKYHPQKPWNKEAEEQSNIVRAYAVLSDTSKRKNTRYGMGGSNSGILRKIFSRVVRRDLFRDLLDSVAATFFSMIFGRQAGRAGRQRSVL